MEHNTDRMWWTIGAVLLGGILIAGAILLLNTTLLPNITTKFDEIDRPAVTHTAYSWSSDGTDRFTTTKPNLNLFTGTSDKPFTKTGTNWNLSVIGVYKTPKVGQEYTVSVEVPEADHNLIFEVFRWNNAGARVGSVVANKVVKSGEKAYVTFTWTDPGSSGATQFAANLAWTNGTDTGTYSYCKAKSEIGKTPTDWTPAPEDVM